MPKTKRFIDKKTAVSFHLVHRSQKDPLAADEKAPQRVLVPVATKQESQEQGATALPQDPTKKKEEQHKYGIYFDDDYDYLQHLREVNHMAEWELAEDSKGQNKVWKAPPAKDMLKGCKLQLPSSVFESDVQEEVGLLNKAAPHSGPRLDFDPDVAAALDDDFDFDDPENQLEDDFIMKANGGDSDEEDDADDDDEYETVDEDEDSEDVDSNEAEGSDLDEINDKLTFLRSKGARFSPTGFNDEDFETKSRFTEYSMSSSVVKRNQGLTLLDDKFEKMFEEYDDDDMGALDCEEIEGHIKPDDQRLLKLVREFEKDMTEPNKYNEEVGKKVRPEVEGLVYKYLETYDENVQEDEGEEEDNEDQEPQKKWDCESILSTYSNLYNHPKLIKEPSGANAPLKISRKTGVPMDVLGKPGLTKKFLDQLNEANGVAPRDEDQQMETQSVLSTLSTLSVRPKNETPEERKERKRLVKDLRKERRVEKKANRIAFKEEKKVQEKQNLNNRSNVHGLKLV